QRQNWALIFTDEASFRQDSTLHATWSRFHYRQDTVFNASTYFAFLQQLARSYRRMGAVLIQDNATYHKDGDLWAWFDANRHWLEVHQLPPYSPRAKQGLIIATFRTKKN